MADNNNKSPNAIAPGSIVEIELTSGFGYVEVCHLHDTYPEVLKVCTKKFAEPVEIPQALVFDQICIFPLTMVIASGKLPGKIIYENVGNNSRFNKAPSFPLFKFAVRDKDGEELYWWLWDGENLELAGKDTVLSDLPERRVMLLNEFSALFG